MYEYCMRKKSTYTVAFQISLAPGQNALKVGIGIFGEKNCVRPKYNIFFVRKLHTVKYMK